MERLNLFDIEFPVYKLPTKYVDIWEEYNVLYLKTIYATYILDNKNVEGDTVGKRRVRLSDISQLYRTRAVYYNMEQFLHSTGKIFMDNIGRCFKYEKTEIVKLKYHKVLDIEYLDSGDCSLLLDINLHIRLSCKRAQEATYLGILHTKYGYILYELTEEHKKDTWKKI